MELSRLVNEWENFSYEALGKREIPTLKLQVLLGETYKALIEYHKQELIPKEISKLLLEIEGFLYFAFLMEEKELETDYYQYRRVNAVVKALENGFFSGDYGCEYPEIHLSDDSRGIVTFNLETENIENIGL